MAQHSKPLITFALVAFNQDRFIKEAVEGAFSQTYSPLEIILSDDCSSDMTFDIMKQMAENYSGPHKIILNRNNRNLGIGSHINRIMELENGELIVGAAGDDISLPERVQENYEAFLKSGEKAMSIHSSCILIDEKGNRLGLKQDFPNGFRIDIDHIVTNCQTKVWGCAHAWHRKVFETFGNLLNEVKLEDEVIPFRSLLIGEIVYIKKPLVLYRIHGNNISANRAMIGKPVERFSSAAEFYNNRTSKKQQILAVYKQYAIDIDNNLVRIGNKEKKRLQTFIRKQISTLEIELKCRMTRNGKSKLLLSRQFLRQIIYRGNLKLMIILFFPKVFSSVSFLKWRLLSLIKHYGQSSQRPLEGHFRNANYNSNNSNF